MEDMEPEITLETPDFKPEKLKKSYELKLLEIPKSPYNDFINSMINDINLFKLNIEEYKQIKAEDGSESAKPFQCREHVIVNNKIFRLQIPVFDWILHNPFLQRIPDILLKDYVGETNYSAQTPLMLSTVLNNINYVQQLITFDVGKLDESDKSALDYAYEFNSSPEIVELLEQYEYGY